VGHFQELGFNYSETAFAIGIPALLAAVGAFGRRDGQVWFFGGVCLVAFLLACATFPLLQLASIAPGFGSADLKRVVFLIGFCLPVLTAIGADRLTEARVPRWLLRLAAIICALSGALALCVALMTPDSIISWFATLYALGPMDEGTSFLMETGRYASVTEAVQAQIRAVALPDEAAVNRGHLLITFLRATVIAGSAWVVLRVLAPSWRLWGLLVLTAAELLHAGSGTVVAVPAERVTRPPAILAPLLLDARDNGVRPRLQRLMAPDNDDLLPLFAPNLGAFHGIEDLAAYNPLPPRRMEEFFLAIEPPDPSRRDVVFGGAGVSAFRRAESLGHPLLDVIALRYVLTEGPVEAPGLVDRTPADAAEPFHLYERTTSLPRATFVQRMIVVPDRQERLRLLADPQRSAADEVVLENLSAPKTTETPAAATVRILEHRDELVRIQVRNQAPGYLRLADPYDPGWTATDNGEPREIFISDHYLRAVYLEPGDHVVEFRFDGMMVVWPERISLLALGIIALCLWPYRRRA
jgi:hypothetical protein